VLTALTKSGILREDAYRIVQANAMKTWSMLGKPGGKNFRENLEADPEVAGRVGKEGLDHALDTSAHLAQLDTIFTRVFGEPGPKAT
jgi:adenylosuccinate lyase